MQIHQLDETHWVIKFEGKEKYDILSIAKKLGRKATDYLRGLIVAELVGEKLKHLY